MEISLISAVVSLGRMFKSAILVVYYVLESVVLRFVPWRFRLKDVSQETVLITGAGNGIGRELAIKFSRISPNVVLLDINDGDMEETVRRIRSCESARSSVHTYVCDVSDPEEVKETANKIREEVGTVTVLINNAGTVSGKTFLELSDQSIQKTFGVNVLAHFWTCRAFLPDMIKKNHGHIVSIASLAPYFNPPKMTDYSASKAAAIAFTECLKHELAFGGLDGVKVTLVNPYHVATELFDGFSALIGSYSPEWVAGEIVNGILSNQEVMTIPTFFLAALFYQALLPCRAVMEIHKRLGVFTCMDGFRGREAQNPKKAT